MWTTSLFCWWVSSGSHIVTTVLSLMKTMDSIYVQNSQTRTYYGYVMERMMIVTDPLKNLLNGDAFEQTPEHVQQIYQLYYFPIEKVHKSVTKTFQNYTEKLKSGEFYDGALKINTEKLREFQIFVDCATELLQSSRKFILDYAKLKPEVFKLCDMSRLILRLYSKI